MCPQQNYSRLNSISVYSIILMLALSGRCYADLSEHLIGEVKLDELKQSPFVEWYDKYQSSYQMNLDVISDLKPLMSDVSIVAFMGTWCHDSQREVPSLVKILEKIDFDKSKFRLIALSYNKDTPSKIEANLDVFRTPTFIFYRQGVEIGRYVEHSKKTLEEDMLAIAAGENYQHAYVKL
ncbi:MAG: thioredoxin family protein [Porticoccaceae bacterium]|nr:thioredoxin family protein [Porticoccaceae bacterium]MDG1474672.1 thioredoxin family protein [Porticoccaceae bacterium]